MRGPSAAVLLERLLIASAAAAGAPVTIDAAQSTAWASATFNGERHVIDLSAASDAGLDRWLAALPSSDLAMRGHLLAELAIAETRRQAGYTQVRLEALTVAGA